MADFQTFAAVFALQNFSTKFKILKKNHFKQKCNGFVTVEIHKIHSWKSWIKCCRQVHQQHQIRIGSGLIVDVRPNLDCHSSPQICGYLIFTRWFIAVADFWLVIFTRQSWMWFLLVIVIAEISAEPCVNVLFFSSQKNLWIYPRQTFDIPP